VVDGVCIRIHKARPSRCVVLQLLRVG
jgi:hypothetical protein